MAKVSQSAAQIIEERKWEEERYARQLAEAEVIRKDPKKMAMARRGAARKANEEMVEARAMQRIAKSGKSKAKARGKKK
jgi:hypothetical protein